MTTQKDTLTSGDFSDTMLRDRRGRRLELSCRMFFFGEDDFEGEATLVDLSTSGCKASSLVESPWHAAENLHFSP